jgi:hypothetical protein
MLKLSEVSYNRNQIHVSEVVTGQKPGPERSQMGPGGFFYTRVGGDGLRYRRSGVHTTTYTRGSGSPLFSEAVAAMPVFAEALAYGHFGSAPGSGRPEEK